MRICLSPPPARYQLGGANVSAFYLAQIAEPLGWVVERRLGGSCWHLGAFHIKWRAMEKVIGLGAGGHARVVLEILAADPGWRLAGLTDPRRELWGTEVLGVRVLGDDALLAEQRQDGVAWAFVGLGGVGDNRPRKRLFELALSAGFQMVTAIHPRAVVSPSAELGPGTQVMAGAVINAGARLGANVIVNSGGIVEHDCEIGDHAHVATGARLASTVRVGEGAHIGLGASVRQCARIGNWTVVGAGAVVIRDLPDRVIAWGAPATVQRGGGD